MSARQHDSHSSQRRQLLQATLAAALLPIAHRATAGPACAAAEAALALPGAGAVQLSGRLIDALGAPLAGRRIELLDAHGHAAHDVCDGDGRFLLGASRMGGPLQVRVEGLPVTPARLSALERDALGTWRAAVGVTQA